MAKIEEQKVIDWDDQITDDGEYSGEESVVLPEGNYPFEVIKVEKAWYDGSSKIPACNMAKVFLRVDGGERGKALCVEHCDGETGRCRVYVDEFTGKDGTEKQSNKIKNFFDKEEQAPKKEFKRGAF